MLPVDAKKRVTTINFDRNKIRKMCADLSKKSDETSAALDAALVNTPVEYEATFDVNETFAEAFEAHMSAFSWQSPPSKESSQTGVLQNTGRSFKKQEKSRFCKETVT